MGTGVGMTNSSCTNGPMKVTCLALIGAVLLATSCGVENGSVGTTDCQAAIARANYRWRVDYEFNKTSSNSRVTDRFEFFASSQLVNINGEEPPDAETGPDENGIWWPALPPRPTPELINERRDRLETHGAPLLLRTVDYFLQCEVGNLSTDRRTYHLASNALSDGATLSATYSLGRVLKLRINNASTNAIAPNREDALENLEESKEAN